MVAITVIYAKIALCCFSFFLFFFSPNTWIVSISKTRHLMALQEATKRSDLAHTPRSPTPACVHTPLCPLTGSVTLNKFLNLSLRLVFFIYKPGDDNTVLRSKWSNRRKVLETVFTLLSSGKEIRGACWLKFKAGNEGVPSHRPYEPLIQISIIQRLDFCLARSYYWFKTKYRNIEYKIPLTSLHYMKITITQKKCVLQILSIYHVQLYQQHGFH